MTQTLKKHPIEHSHKSKHWYLKHIKVFADLPEEDKKELREISHMTSYRKHEPNLFPRTAVGYGVLPQTRARQNLAGERERPRGHHLSLGTRVNLWRSGSLERDAQRNTRSSPGTSFSM